MFKNKKPRDLIINGVAVLLGLIIVSALVYIFAVRPYQVQQQKKKFEQAKTQLEDIKNQIEAKIGKADESSTSESCGYLEQKYIKGPLRCSVGFSLKYPAIDYVTATKYMVDSSVMINSELKSDILRRGDPVFKPRSELRSSQRFVQTIDMSDKLLSCSITYQFPDSIDENDIGTGLNIWSYCSGYPIGVIYTVE